MQMCGLAKKYPQQNERSPAASSCNLNQSGEKPQMAPSGLEKSLSWLIMYPRRKEKKYLKLNPTDCGPCWPQRYTFCHISQVIYSIISIVHDFVNQFVLIIAFKKYQCIGVLKDPSQKHAIMPMRF